MYSLQSLHKINAEAAQKPRHEDELSRHCSYHVSVARSGNRTIILHSAKQRSTAAIENQLACRKFLCDVQATNSVEKRDALIEGYFSAAPRGKQRLKN